jgi:hypothetical protein
MRKVEVRVRPVIRHIVTLYESGPLPGTKDKYHATLDTLGEFDNEAQAEFVAEALRKQADPTVKPPALSNQYVIVPTSGTKAYLPGLAWSLEDAKEQKDKCEAEYGEPFAIGILLMSDPPPPQLIAQANGPQPI